MVDENKTPPPEAEGDEDNTKRDGNEQNEGEKTVREFIKEFLEKAERDLNNLEKLTAEIKAELTSRNIAIPDDINNAVQEAVEEFVNLENAAEDISGDKEKVIDPDEQIEKINYWLNLAEKSTDINSAILNLEVVEDELAVAKKANIDTDRIANLEERIEKVKEKINSEKEKKTKTEPVILDSQPEPEPTPKPETPEAKETAKENKKFADEVEKKVNENSLDDEMKERNREWNSKDKDEKKKDIEEEEKGIKTKLGDRLKERTDENNNAEFASEEDINSVFESQDELVKFREKLGKEVEENMVKNREISDRIKAGINPDLDLTQLNETDKAEAKNVLEGFLKNTKDALSINEIDYLLEEMNKPEDLLENHMNRKIKMEELQAIIDAIEEYKEFMKRFEEMTKEQKEEIREEVARLVEQLSWWEKHNKKVYYLLLGLGVVGGILGIASLLGMAGSAAVPYATMENAILAAKVVGAGAAIYKRKDLKKYLGKGAGIAFGAGIGAAVILDALFDGKWWDEKMAKLCGVSVPESVRSGKDKGK